LIVKHISPEVERLIATCGKLNLPVADVGEKGENRYSERVSRKKA
jgi:hypothetical protein